MGSSAGGAVPEEALAGASAPALHLVGLYEARPQPTSAKPTSLKLCRPRATADKLPLRSLGAEALCEGGSASRRRQGYGGQASAVRGLFAHDKISSAS